MTKRRKEAGSHTSHLPEALIGELGDGGGAYSKHSHFGTVTSTQAEFGPRSAVESLQNEIWQAIRKADEEKYKSLLESMSALQRALKDDRRDEIGELHDNVAEALNGLDVLRAAKKFSDVGKEDIEAVVAMLPTLTQLVKEGRKHYEKATAVDSKLSDIGIPGREGSILSAVAKLQKLQNAQKDV